MTSEEYAEMERVYLAYCLMRDQLMDEIAKAKRTLQRGPIFLERCEWYVADYKARLRRAREALEK
jgi:hypothetical protein